MNEDQRKARVGGRQRVSHRRLPGVAAVDDLGEASGLEALEFVVQQAFAVVRMHGQDDLALLGHCSQSLDAAAEHAPAGAIEPDLRLIAAESPTASGCQEKHRDLHGRVAP